MTFAFPPSPTTKMISFHGKQSWSFMVRYIIVVLSFNMFMCSSLQPEWWPTPYTNQTFQYTNGSTFVSNLNVTLNRLLVEVEHTSQGRFNTSVYGQTPNRIYAFLQCRGDATVFECYNCSRQAKIDALQYCGNYVGCSVWANFCFLRYNGNYNFIGHLDVTGDNNRYNRSASAAYAKAARHLLSNLSSAITAGTATNRYASGLTPYSSANSSESRSIFGLAQCWEDIPLDDCKTCLSTRIDELFKNNNGIEGARGMARSCIIRYEGYQFFNPSPPPIYVASPPPEKSSSKLPIIFGVTGGFLLLLIMFLFGIRKKLKSALSGSRQGGYYEGGDSRIRENKQQTSQGHVLERIPSLSRAFTVFEMETLIAATENFHDNNKLGQGGFGAVYKGTTPEGKEIAVKKLSLESRQGKKEFLNEVKLVAKVQHRNLVKLLGCCEAGSERLLVYEYLPNNSLDKILFDPDRRMQLDWKKRYNIILGITRGLLYLHEDSHLRIIHRDIKASNILLDEKLNPKIADFGLARLFPEDETHISTRVAGTFGYIAPEYAMQGQLSVKADVYSFGVVLLELIAGRKNTDYSLSPEMQMLLGWAWKLYKRGDILQMIDPTIIETCDQAQALRWIHVGLLCTQSDSSLRPPMSTVILMLSSHSVTLPDPKKPAFMKSRASQNTKSTSSAHSHVSRKTKSSSSGSGLSHSHASGTSTSSSVLSASSSSPLVAPPSKATPSNTYLVP